MPQLLLLARVVDRGGSVGWVESRETAGDPRRGAAERSEAALTLLREPRRLRGNQITGIGFEDVLSIFYFMGHRRTEI